jgi:hypothetical protein
MLKADSIEQTKKAVGITGAEGIYCSKKDGFILRKASHSLQGLYGPGSETKILGRVTHKENLLF